MLHYDPDTVQGLFLFGVCAYKLDGANNPAGEFHCSRQNGLLVF